MKTARNRGAGWRKFKRIGPSAHFGVGLAPLGPVHATGAVRLPMPKEKLSVMSLKAGRKCKPWLIRRRAES